LNRTLVLLLTLPLLGACSSSSRNACAKGKECCSTMSRCEDVNRSGAGWEDRCEIDLSGAVEKYQTYGLEACNTVAARLGDFIACLGSLQCADVSGSDGRAAKCDVQAKAYCNALKGSGDACGNDWSRTSCDNYQAELSIVF